MSDDLLITPGSRKLEIKDTSGNVDAKIETDASGNLLITNAGGDISIGDTSSDVFIGDGTNSVDIVFEQDGEIRGTSGVTLTLGASGSSVAMASDLSLGGNDLTNVGNLTVTGNLTITGDINSYNVTDLDVSDKTITLGVGQTEANSGNSGIIIDGSSASIIWDETNDRWSFNKGISTSGPISSSATSGSSFYAASFTRSSSTLTTPDIWGSSSTLVFGTSSSDERLALSTDGALIYGRALVRNASSDQNTSQDSASIPDTTGPEIMRFEGSYTNGTYTTEFAKVDRSGNLPLYVRQSKGTANSFSNIARFGDHGQTNGTDVFAVFGGARVGGRVTADNLTLNSISTQSSEATVLTINGSNVIGKRELGSNAFNSTAFLTSSSSLNASNISSGTLASARLPDLTVSDFAGSAIQTGSESFADSDTALMTAAAVQDKILSYGYTTNVGDVTSVSASSPLSVGGGGGPSPSISFVSAAINTSTSDADGDFFLVHSGTTSSGGLFKLTKANINLSGFNNDSGFLTNITTQTDPKYLRSDTSDTFSGGTITFEAPTDGTAVFMTKATDSPDEPAILVLAGDADSEDDLAFEIRGNTTGSSVDLSTTMSSADTKFAIFQSGHTTIGYNSLGTGYTPVNAYGLNVNGTISAVNGYYAGSTQVINSSGNWVGGGNISEFTNNSGYLTSSSGLNASNLTSGTVPDARIAASSITQHTDSKYLRSDVSDVYAGRTLSFGIVGNGTNTNGSFFSIEGNTDSSGEGSGRIFFREHNSSTAAEDNFGMSLGYRGGATTITTAGGNSNTTAALVSNGQWFMVGHDANNQGALIMYGDRAATFVDFSSNNVRGIGTLTAASATITGLSTQSSEATVLTINGSNVVGKRDLGSNAFNSTTIPTNNNQLTNGAGYITASNSAITNKLPLAGGTLTGKLTMDENGFSVSDAYHSWKRNYVVSSSSPQEILYHDGTSLDNGGVYRFTAHISGTGTDQNATAVFWNQNGTWKVNVTGQSGTSSNHPEFIISSSTNKPTIHIDHASAYTIIIYHEWLQLNEELTGTDNAGYAFGTDAFLGSVGDKLYFNPGGTAATGANPYDDGDEVYHEGHKPTYSELGTMAYSNLTGTPTIPSLSGYATESYVGTQISNLVDSAPSTLDTLNELAAALGDDANFSTTVTNSIATKLPLAGGTLTGTLDLNAADSLSFESGKHWITWNDGEGNFNIRVGHKSDSSTNEVSTETGYVFHDEWSQSSGWREFNISASSITAGADVGTWRKQMYYDTNSVYIAYQGSTKFNTTSAGVSIAGNIAVSGTVDGVDIAARDAVLTSTTTTANAALPKAGGTMTGDLQAPGLYVGSTNTSYDFYNNGTTYLNGNVRVNATLTVDAGNIEIAKDNPVLILNETTSSSNANQVAYISFQDNGTEEAWIGWGSSGNTDFTITNNIGSVVLNGNGTTQINDNLDLNGNADISGNITVTGEAAFNGTKLEGDSKEMLRFSDTWLRINPDNDFTSGIYCGTGLLRTDGTFQVGASGTKFAVNGANGNVTLAGTVDGRDVATDGTKLDTIATNADVTPSWVPSSNPNYLTSSSGLNASNLTSGTVPDARIAASSITQHTDSKYLRSNANDTLSSTLKVTGSIIHEFNTAGGYIARPKGAQYVTSTNAHTGAIKIKLPTHGTDDMMSFWVDIYDYSTGESVTLWIGGYLYQTTGNNEWVNTTALIFTEQTGKAPENVRFGADGSNNCVWIGETTDTWSYPQIIVRDFQCGYSADIDAYDDNWSITFVTSFDTVDETHVAKGPVTEWDRVEGKPTIPTNNNQLTNGAGYITDGNTNWNNTYGFITSTDSSITNKMPLAGGTFTGAVTIEQSGTPTLSLSDSGNAGGGGASGKILFSNTGGNAMGIGYTGDSTADSDFIISSNAGGTYGGYLGLDAGAITDAQSDIILEPKTNVRIATGSIEMGSTVFIDQSRNMTVGTISSGQITATKIHAGGDSTSFTDGTDPDISTDNIYATEKVVSPKIVWLNDASGDDNYVTCDDNNSAYTVKGQSAGAWWQWYGDKTLGYAGHKFDYWKGNGAELTGFIQFTGTGTDTNTGGYIYFGNATTYKINPNQQSVFAPGSTTSSTTRKGIKFYHGQGPEPVIWYHATGTGTGMLKIYSNNVGVGDMFALDATNGDGHFKGDVTAYSTTTTSDIKLKENVRDLEGALDTTLKLRGVKFDWKDENKDNDQLGFIAQEVEEVLPEIVKEVTSLSDDNTETHKSVNYSAVVPVLVEAIKELKQEIDDLKEQLKNKEL